MVGCEGGWDDAGRSAFQFPTLIERRYIFFQGAAAQRVQGSRVRFIDEAENGMADAGGMTSTPGQ